MRSRFYYQGHNIKVADAIKDYLNSHRSSFLPEIAVSTRAIGDALQFQVAQQLKSFLGEWCSEYSSEFARRAMADMAFTDVDGVYTIVDVKTHREDTHFNMPNLTSVKRLSRLYESDINVFSVIMIKYLVQETTVIVSDVLFVPIEFFDWKCLTIGALGWGQIQITNANDIQLLPQNSRRDWMLQLCNAMMVFYPREIEKITDRIRHFEKMKMFWENKKDIWIN